MSFLDDPKNRQLYIQYKAVFNQGIPLALLKDETLRTLSLTIDYGKIGYSEEQSAILANNHIKMHNYNRLLTDDIILSMHKLTADKGPSHSELLG